MEKKELPIFFAVDDCYVPFLAVTLKSLVDSSSFDNLYAIKILCTSISEENKIKIKRYESKNISIEFVDVTEHIEKLTKKLCTRDYYSKTTYYRLFIPEMYKDYDKALYLDSDIVILEDIADLFNIDIGNNLIAAVPDEAVRAVDEFKEYVEKVIGVTSYKDYFNAGVMLMNLKELRNFKFQEKFISSLSKVTFTVAQDQDYLNSLCKGRVKILDSSWNTMPINVKENEDDIKLIHYNLACKPWHIETPYQDYFWNFAKGTEYFDDIVSIKENYTDEQRLLDIETNNRLVRLAKNEADCVYDDKMYRG